MTDKKHVLACIDGSAITDSVCDYASWYASRLGLPVTLLNVIEVPASTRQSLAGTIGMNNRQELSDRLTQLDAQRSELANDYSQALVADAKNYITANYDIEVDTYRRRGKLLSVIEHIKDQNLAIVMGRHGEDYKNGRINVGSHIETIARATSMPMLICSQSFKAPSSYMIAFDASETAIKAVDLMAKSSLLKDMLGHIVMVGHHNEASKQSLLTVTEQLQSAGFKVESHHLPESDAVEALLDFQQKNQIELIVIGAYGRSKWQQLFLGSTTTKLIAKTSLPILLLR